MLSEVEEPIRAEIFGIERLEQHAESLAAAQGRTDDPRRGRHLLPRVQENARVLLAGYRNIAETVLMKQEITPAAEWILDNFHIVDEQLRGIRDHLPGGYYRLLPRIAEGHLEGFPRIYGLAWAYVAHTDSRFEMETLRQFVRAYQRVQPLTIGELWAVAIHLRVALVENLRRLTELIIRSRRERARADDVADRLLGVSERPDEQMESILRSAGASPMTRAFAVQLVQRLRGQDPSIMPALHWLDERLSSQGTSADEMVTREHQAQAAATVTVRNIITSMRWMSSIYWPDFFESVSLVDEVLRAAPGFAAMEFTTRDEYRAGIERLSRGSGRAECDVAREAVRLAAVAVQADGERPSALGLPGVPDRPEEDPGYYILGEDRWAFEERLGFRVPIRTRLRRAFQNHALLGYLGGITLLTSAIISGLLLLTWNSGAPVWLLAMLGIIGLVPTSEIAVSLVQRLIPLLVPPRLLPKLELPEGVPAQLRTLVVVPTMLTRDADIEQQIERLEVHYLANPEGHLHFALLTDWADAPQELMPGDSELLATLADGITQLNYRYGGAPGGGKRFLLLHRRRLWNEKEGKWIGWERKRGKIHELNRLLRGDAGTTYVPLGGQPPAVPEGVRYVITLDADTRLPRGTARRLVGAMAHPLNRPHFDPRKGRVVKGYGILQPRLTPSLPTGPNSTTYQRIISGPGGVDPYSGAISDVYQDLLGEGSYTGKGIYDVDAFEAALEGKVPENTLLSHDLFEGSFARAGLATDVDLFEEFPTNYEVAARRNHRWVRGDWQLLPWVLGHARDTAGGRQKASISTSGRWKMVDNLRRSLVAPAGFLLAVMAWLLPAVPSLLWTGLVVGSIVVPSIIPVLDGLIPRRWGISKRSHLRAVGHDIFVALSQTGMAFTMLAYQTCLMTDAIVRTLARIYITRRNLLEWRTAAQAGYGAEATIGGFYRHLRSGVILAAGTGILFALFNPLAWIVAGPLVLLWMASPVIAWRVSVPPKIARSQVLSPEEIRSLRLIARRTWRFFEVFVDQEDHCLPPDNFQEDPDPVVAHRTSPTNMGLYLLSTTIARDFGWIGSLDTADRLKETLQTMTKLHRVRGHFINWYDTRDLRPLEPLYVSTVDSGNLAGHLIALAQACRDFMSRSRFGPERDDGIRDALSLLLDSIEKAGNPGGDKGDDVTRLRGIVEEMSALLDFPSTPPECSGRLAELGTLADTLVSVARSVEPDVEDGAGSEIRTWAGAVRDCVLSHARDLEVDDSDLALRFSSLAQVAEGMARGMDFRFLFDASRKIFSIGYRVTDDALDPGGYDLLASEARLATFIAIAKGDILPQHWFGLGRALTPVGGGAALVSWSGSMFEYLMPLLVMRQPARSLLDLTCRLVVGRQIRYGAERGVPWGISESTYNVRDAELTYQYSDFGVPGLGLKRGLFEDVVVAPYATALAAMVDPRAALANFSHLERAGALGTCGFYDALDYTPSRLPENTRVAVVRAYMAHHQGMTIVSLSNVLHEGLAQARFHSHPMVQAAELLLQERTPRSVAVARPRGEEVLEAAHVRDLVPPTLRLFESPHDITPRTHLLSNGHYTVMLTAAGSGFSRWNGLALTRWREDTTRDCWGTFLFLRDVKTGVVRSAGFQPSGTAMDRYEVIYAEDRAKIVQRDTSLSITLECVVSPEDDAELRRLTVTNLENRPREIDVTSYAECVLATQAADEAHPAFSNLFVETEFVPGYGTLLATRRPRSSEEPRIWLAHLVADEQDAPDTQQYETDRARFLGRGRWVRSPHAVHSGEPLSNTSGTVLDPILSLRRRVAIPPLESVRLVFTTLVAGSRERALESAEKYRQPATFERASSLAWTQAQVQLHHLQITQDEAHLFQRLANRLIYADRTLRASQQELAANRGNVTGLWPHGISGDLPIALVRIEREEERDIVRQLLRAHEYWRLKGVPADLVILNAKHTSYAQDLQQSIEAMARLSQSSAAQDTPGARGGIFVLREDLLPQDQLSALRAASRVLILANRGSLSEQTTRLARTRPGPPPPRPITPHEEHETRPLPALYVEYWNGLGGFTPDGREYIMVLDKERSTPAPWINVVANPSFGFQVSESGSGYTWCGNSRENKLTPWSNDPVSDTPGETFYVRDEDNGQVWGPTRLPMMEDRGPYVIRHGQGYSHFEHASHGIALALLQFVPLQDPIKISRLTLENRTDRRRRLSVTAYAEWVLGVARNQTASQVVTDIDPVTGAMFARNVWNGEFADRIAFADLIGGRDLSLTGDRTEFLGRNAGIDHPAALELGEALSGNTGAGMDPCAALRTIVELAPGESTELIFLLGQGEDGDHSRALIHRYRGMDCDSLLDEVREHWDRVLGAVQVKTPDLSMNLLLNRWLIYQTLVCRILARSATYQSGGAFGFRDQIQDVMALTVMRPDIVREHLLQAAARQFREGDVQHWWHPPTGRGVRTRISDDRLWLPFAVTQYLDTTGDVPVLDEEVSWLDGAALKDDQQESYFEPVESTEKGTLFEHCARALDLSLDVGSHGLPLIGAGDWNDGMNRVGHGGRGESVWLGWFLIANLRRFARCADQRGEAERADRWRVKASSIEDSLEKEAWDGDWYRRAFFDDGTPLGSVSNDECRIDSISQSWAVLSGAGDPERARQAMESLERSLVRRDDRLILLLSPPFNKSRMDPGYIKGYPPGIRENGGQYTHAAIWSILAFAELGDGDKAGELFDLLNPIHLADDPEAVRRYMVEPYAVAADIYSQPPHTGRGGWTWYTGAAGWLHRAGLEWILGFRKRGSTILIDPCIPRHWEGFEITYRHGGRDNHGTTLYRIRVENPKAVCRGVSRCSLDGKPLPAGDPIPLCDDGLEHTIRVELG